MWEYRVGSTKEKQNAPVPLTSRGESSGRGASGVGAFSAVEETAGSGGFGSSATWTAVRAA